MLLLITGGSGSGKSEYAENLAMSLGEKRVYAATMIASGEEGRQRVRRHQKMRETKNFHTLECPLNLESITDFEGTKNAVVLLECMSNLVANEMFFAQNQIPSDAWLTDKILQGIETVIRHCSHLIVVTNEVFSDGTTYDTETEHYIKVLGAVNVRLSAMAVCMTEVVCGIPIEYPQQAKWEMEEA